MSYHGLDYFVIPQQILLAIVWWPTVIFRPVYLIFIITISFFLSFFTGTVTTKMLEEEESVNAIRQLTEQFDEVRLYIMYI